MSTWTLSTDPRVAGIVEVNDPLAAIVDDLTLRLTNPEGLVAVASDEGSELEGLDLRSYLRDTPTETDLGTLASRVEEQCLMDPRVTSATATVTYAAQLLTVSVACDTDAGRFPLELHVAADGTVSVGTPSA